MKQYDIEQYNEVIDDHPHKANIYKASNLSLVSSFMSVNFSKVNNSDKKSFFVPKSRYFKSMFANTNNISIPSSNSARAFVLSDEFSLCFHWASVYYSITFFSSRFVWVKSWINFCLYIRKASNFIIEGIRPR